MLVKLIIPIDTSVFHFKSRKQHNLAMLSLLFFEGGQLFVVEKFLSEDKTGPENPVISILFSAIIDLEGDYRTEQEYRS